MDFPCLVSDLICRSACYHSTVNDAVLHPRDEGSPLGRLLAFFTHHAAADQDCDTLGLGFHAESEQARLLQLQNEPRVQFQLLQGRANVVTAPVRDLKEDEAARGVQEPIPARHHGEEAEESRSTAAKKSTEALEATPSAPTAAV